MTRRDATALVVVLLGLVGLTGCRQQMAEQPRYNPMSESTFWNDGHSARPLEPGTVARGQLRNDALLYEGLERHWWGATEATRFPFPVTTEVLERGREQFNIRCAVCHDRVGHGLGKIPQRGYVQPPSYHLEPTLSKSDGHYFRVITHGHGAMPALAEEIGVRDRWCVVAYIRALQFSQSERVRDAMLADKKEPGP